MLKRRMKPEQLSMFPYRKPLLDLFGREFFRQIPACPGVYWFASETGKVLYVGQSRDLRARLRYYKNARPEREPRRILRLVVRVRRIFWEVCPSAGEAQVREVQMIQNHWPTYNRSNNLSAIYPFFVVETSESGVLLRLADDSNCASGAQAFGAFKGRGACRRVLLGLGRLFWMAQNEGGGIWDVPVHLGELSRLTEVLIPAAVFGRGSGGLLRDYFRGVENALEEPFTQLVSRVQDAHLRVILERDLVAVIEFFAAGPQQNRKLAEENGLPGLMLKEQVDELRVRSRARLRASAGEAG